MSYDKDLLKYQEFYFALGEYREEIVSSTLTYKGWAPHGTLESATGWIIQRVASNGTVIYQEIAPKTGNTLSKSTQVWNDRATLFTAPPWGDAICTSLDGINDYVNFGNNLNFERTDPWTFSCWLYVENITTAMTIFSKRSASGGTPGLQFNMLSNGRLEANLVNTAATNHLRLQMAVAILAKTRYHICWTYDGSSSVAGLKLYLNGTLITLSTITNNLSASILTATDAMIGQFGSGQYLNGRINEVSFWSDDLTSTEVLELYNGGVIEDPNDHTQESILSNYWQAGDGDTFPIWTDSKGSIDGTMTNMVASELTRDLP